MINSAQFRMWTPQSIFSMSIALFVKYIVTHQSDGFLFVINAEQFCIQNSKYKNVEWRKSGKGVM